MRSYLKGVVGFLRFAAHGKSPRTPKEVYWHNSCVKDGLGDRALEIGRSLDRREGDRWEASTLDERPAMLIQLTVFVPAVIAIYAATGAWVFSCDPISKTVDIVRGGLLYGWIGVLFMCARVLVFPY
jgi:hypothetical protein